MMIPQRLTPELSNDATRSPARPRTPSLVLCVVGLLSVLGCKGTIDNNEQSYTLQPNGTSGGMTAAPGGTAPAPRAPGGAASGSGGEQVGGNISGLDGESASDDRPSGGSRRRASDRDRDDEDEGEREDADAGLEEPLADAGVLLDAGIVDGGVIEIDAGLAVDAGSAP